MPQISASILRKKVKVKRRGTRIKTPSLSPPKRTCLTELMRDASLSKPSENVEESRDGCPRHARAHSWTTVTPPSSPAREKYDDDFKTPSTICSSPEPQLELPPGTPPETPKKISFKLKSSMIKSSKTDYRSDTSTDSSSSEPSVSSRSTPRVYRSKRASRSTSTSSSASSAPKKSKKERSKAAKRKKKNESRSRSRSPKSKPSSSSKRRKTTRRTSSSPSPTSKKKDLKRKRSQSSSRSCSPDRKTNAHLSRRGKKDRKVKKEKDKSPSRDHSGADSPHRKKKKHQSRSPEHDRSSPRHKGHKKKQKRRERSRSPSHDRSRRHSRRSRSRSPRYPARPVTTQQDRQLREPSKEIVVFNIPKSCTAKELHEIFKEFGLIEEVNVVRDRFTGQSRGFAFIAFEELESAKRTIEKIVDSMEIEGRRLQGNYSWGQNRLPDAEQHQYGTRKKW